MGGNQPTVVIMCGFILIPPFVTYADRPKGLMAFEQGMGDSGAKISFI
jgi:hypothetical protein